MKIYQIYIGSDFSDKPIAPETLINQFDNFKKAKVVYSKCQDKCKNKCAEKNYKAARNYCYMVRLDTEKKLVGWKEGKQIDNGCVSYTIAYHNYSAMPRLHGMEDHEECAINLFSEEE